MTEFKESDNPVNPALCPLCGHGNECGRALGAVEELCWCATAKISPKLIALVPPREQGLACICQQCLSAFRESDWPDLGDVLNARLRQVRRDR